MIGFYGFVPEEECCAEAAELAASLSQQLAGEPASHARMIRFRLAGGAAAECVDRYFFAGEGGRCVSRIWYGWGRHAEAVGNFGNFKTEEALRGQGIGRRLFDMLKESLKRESDLPLALFCTSSKPHLVRLYGEIGFRPAITGSEGGPLYAPLCGSPERFSDFCRRYYAPAFRLRFEQGGIGFRHEVDCLLRFALLELGENAEFGLCGYASYEAAFLAVAADPSAGRLERVATDSGRTAGWAFTPRGGVREVLVHPAFRSFLPTIS